MTSLDEIKPVTYYLEQIISTFKIGDEFTTRMLTEMLRDNGTLKLARQGRAPNTGPYLNNWIKQGFLTKVKAGKLGHNQEGSTFRLEKLPLPVGQVTRTRRQKMNGQAQSTLMETTPFPQPSLTTKSVGPFISIGSFEHLVDFLTLHYDNKAERYREDWSDRGVGDELNIPSAWVTLIRDSFFGAHDRNETSSKEVEKLNSKISELLTSLAALQEEARLLSKK